MRAWLRWRWWLARLLALVALLLLGPIGVLASGKLDLDTPWHSRERSATGQAPDPAIEQRAVVQVYGARIVRWRGAFGIHPWIAVKRAGADTYTTWQIMGWRARYGGNALMEGHGDAPDTHWYGAYPQLLADHRGPAAEAMIDRIEAAVARYPWTHRYGLWPGPNSNTFVAWVAREVPELRLDLPPTAIGKDYLGATQFVASAPSGTGWQLSLLGLAGITLARDEGLELNLLGLGFGVDLDDLALRLPGVGKLPGSL
ncbi:DUF3750 domain-containing protein [Pseudorhodoferax sp.]|uniref:DUF3750 domain-containing protein n=1 Tax=Pseudorhodoferax sp. TaxID=1993553 RepID=UPI002DD619D5|nr:DUF3750 domain-containing protein [Pseudorhodoferax sp.]